MEAKLVVYLFIIHMVITLHLIAILLAIVKSENRICSRLSTIESKLNHIQWIQSRELIVTEEPK